MRDKRFIAAHRGGPLSLEDHRLLMLWAVDVVLHGVQTLQEIELDARGLYALEIAVKWAHGNASIGEARRAAVSAHDAAKNTTHTVKKAVYRACGHAVATAHMADHSLHARAYMLKAFQQKKMDSKIEEQWQIQQANSEIKTLLSPVPRVRD